MTTLPIYEAYAIRYATHERNRSDNFIWRDGHDGPMPIDYYVWLLRGGGRTLLVDTGFNADMAKRRQRRLLRCPIAALEQLDVKPADVDAVVITHLHYDHAGNLRLLPHAKLHLQEKEMQYATGRWMSHDAFRHAFEFDDVTEAVRGVYEKRMVFHDGDDEIAPGVRVVHVGGHTLGLQGVRVHTRRGWLMLASDGSHFYENAQKRAPFPIVHDVGQMMDGYAKLLSLAESPAHFVPGHDPLVRTRYPALHPDAPDIVKLHDDPL